MSDHIHCAEGCGYNGPAKNRCGSCPVSRDTPSEAMRMQCKALTLDDDTRLRECDKPLGHEGHCGVSRDTPRPRGWECGCSQDGKHTGCPLHAKSDVYLIPTAPTAPRERETPSEPCGKPHCSDPRCREEEYDEAHHLLPAPVPPVAEASTTDVCEWVERETGELLTGNQQAAIRAAVASACAAVRAERDREHREEIERAVEAVGMDWRLIQEYAEMGQHYTRYDNTKGELNPYITRAYLARVLGDLFPLPTPTPEKPRE